MISTLGFQATDTKRQFIARDGDRTYVIASLTDFRGTNNLTVVAYQGREIVAWNHLADAYFREAVAAANALR